MKGPVAGGGEPAPARREAEGADRFGAFVSRRSGEAAKHGGALAGARLCIKDNIEVAGEPFSAGHPLFEARRGQTTAPAVKRLLDAGARFVGMTRTDAGGFGMTTPEVQNPAAPGRTAGGSSGGAAAAIAAGLADIGLGTDTGGSVRVPAACTGIFGFKPSFGLAPVEGCWPMAPSFDHVGLMAPSLALIQRAAPPLLGSAPTVAPHPQRLTVSLIRTPGAAAAPAMEAVEHALRAAGHQLRSFIPPNLRQLVRAFGTVVVAEALPVYASLSEAEKDRLGPAARAALRHPPSGEAADSARALLAAARQAYERELGEADLLLTPTLLAPAPSREAETIDFEGRPVPVLRLMLMGTCFANVLGAPALAAPIGVDFGGLPFSLHIVAAKGNDNLLLGAASSLLAALPPPEARATFSQNRPTNAP